jgi:hypothetical protein
MAGCAPPAVAPSDQGQSRAEPASFSSCRREPPVLRRRTDEVPFVAGDVEEHGDAAVGFGTRCREELHARGCHPRVRGAEVLNVEEETHPAGGLLPGDGGEARSACPAAWPGLLRPVRPAPVRAGGGER